MKVMSVGMDGLGGIDPVLKGPAISSMSVVKSPNFGYLPNRRAYSCRHSMLVMQWLWKPQSTDVGTTVRGQASCDATSGDGEMGKSEVCLPERDCITSEVRFWINKVFSKSLGSDSAHKADHPIYVLVVGDNVPVMHDKSFPR